MLAVDEIDGRLRVRWQACPPIADQVLPISMNPAADRTHDDD
ncbi:hypothetical protein [Thiohalocapsa halophila]|nr:hypothetical protein [Thiohalocapsa halophila]